MLYLPLKWRNPEVLEHNGVSHHINPETEGHMASQILSQARLKELLHYDPETGDFRWRTAARHGQITPWSLAGSPHSQGYVVLKVAGKSFRAHRLAWMYMTGSEPANDIDHIDGVKSNNQWRNLREATTKQNAENTPLRSDNSTGYRGVTFDAKKGLYRARIRHNGELIGLGRFKTAEQAAEAARAARAQLFTHDHGRAA
jgi:uncharacterized protein YegP (UPF0339 family)